MAVMSTTASASGRLNPNSDGSILFIAALCLKCSDDVQQSNATKIRHAYAQEPLH